ncbi:hypothetical protein FOS14_23925 [Skermania sp. ID1734]|uniref:hypothetical protein n=1 Tax=Skermania sp. ID1734 TaxID=2597516 RepID=UPI0011811F23|nr:hypothetical protein [Skermania sp. ID1734]TSD93040.1 hypothetical protein FOS14_23925 [Skermania sp. ID1734]
MPRPSKGERKAWHFRAHTEVDLDAAARAAGYSITGQFIADALYTRLGRSDLVEGPNRPDKEIQTALPLTA